MANNPLSPLFLLAFFLFAINPLQNSHATQNQKGFSLKMIHRHSPESPTYRANLTEDEKLIELFQSSNARVKSLANSLSGHTNLITRPPLGFFVQNYYVQVGFGTFDKDPKYRNFYLGIDTGSDLTWTQCEGCTKCFFQTDPYFPPTRSTSYKLVPCYQCPSPCQGEDKCRLTRRYGDGATLRAIAATETLHFQSVDNKTVYVTDVFIGCGRAMLNFKEEHIEGNKVSGLLGMGYGDASIWKQKSQLTQRRFSYCLQSPVTATEGKLQMYLRFGDDIVEAPKMKSTPLHQYRDRPQYYLTLEGISVGGQRLPVDPAVYKIKPDGSGGCVIDSGSFMSYVVSEAYSELVKAVSHYFEIYNRNLRKIPDPTLGARLCYERFQDPSRVMLPIIAFHFSYSADFAMQPHAAYAFELTKTGNGLICMMILESTRTEHYGITYLGAHQQSNHRIVFDLNNNQLRFGPMNCAESN